MAEQENTEFISPHKYIKNTTTNGTVRTAVSRDIISSLSVAWLLGLSWGVSPLLHVRSLAGVFS